MRILSKYESMVTFFMQCTGKTNSTIMSLTTQISTMQMKNKLQNVHHHLSESDLNIEKVNLHFQKEIMVSQKIIEIYFLIYFFSCYQF
ncbi:unnamed protein product [Larinioides sclopetarius]|uniref:Uncharacterized protein n=1 Tax=Larinioides sclopetarius TaxID=280406 RepID=A0AAV2B346_9ARAC